MKKFAVLPALFLAGALAWAQDDKCDECGDETYGTSVQWSGGVTEAAKLAKEQQKLVFVLHVSGYFEDPKFT